MNNQQRKNLAKKLRSCVIPGFLLALIIWIIGFNPTIAHAATFTVTLTTDAVDVSPGNGTCLVAGGGCTLRAAIQEANALPGADIIILPAGTYTLTIAGTGEDNAATGDLDITDHLTITGAGQGTTIIDGGSIDRVFDIDPSDTNPLVKIELLSITNGNAGAANGGGIYNNALGGAFVELIGVTLYLNSAADGGGIANQGASMSLTSVSVSDNTASGWGGGIYSTSSDDILFGGINSNSAVAGGGIYTAGNFTLTNVTVSGNNTTDGNGGGINIDSTANVTITASTISGNIAASDGGGIYSISAGNVNITNSTISGNSASSSGGGIFNANLGSSIPLALVNSTVANNDASPVTGAGIHGHSISLTSGSLLSNATLLNTIVADNTTGNNCTGASGTITSLGNNLSSSASCPFTAGGDQLNTDPMLGALANNGGITQTHALSAGSPAIDAGTNTGCPATDQRGIARPIDGDLVAGAVCDIGAYEADTMSPNIDVSPLSVNFGSIATGSFSTRTVTVANAGTGSLDLGTILPPVAPFSRSGGTCVNGQTLLPGASCTIVLRYTPISATPATGGINVPSNDPDVGTANGQNNVLVMLTGSGFTMPPPTSPPDPGPDPGPGPGPGGTLPPDLGGPPLWPFTAASTSGEALVADDTGVVVAGFASNGGNFDLLLARFNTSGVKQWERRLDLGGHEFGYGLAQDSKGRLTVVGYSQVGVVAGMLVAQYDANGNLLWQKIVPGNFSAGYAVVAAPDDSLYVTGERWNGANTDLWLLKLSSAGDVLWSTVHNEGGSEIGYGLALAPAGLYAVGSKDNHLWGCLFNLSGAVQSCATGNPGIAYQVAIEPTSQDLYLGGLLENATRDGFVARFNPATGFVWVGQGDGGQEDLVRGMVLDKNGFVYATGRTGEGGNADLFGIAINGAGQAGTLHRYSGGGFDAGHAIAVDPQGRVYATGVTSIGGIEHLLLLRLPGGPP